LFFERNPTFAKNRQTWGTQEREVVLRFKINGSREIGSHPAEKRPQLGTCFGRPAWDGTVESHPSATDAL